MCPSVSLGTNLRLHRCVNTGRRGGVSRMVDGPWVVSFPDTHPSSGPGCGLDVPVRLWPWVSSGWLLARWKEAGQQPFLLLPWEPAPRLVKGSTSFGSDLSKAGFCFPLPLFPFLSLAYILFLQHSASRNVVHGLVVHQTCKFSRLSSDILRAQL